MRLRTSGGWLPASSHCQPPGAHPPEEASDEEAQSLVVNIATSEDRAQQTHRTVLTNPEWPNMFGTGLERLWSRLSFLAETPCGITRRAAFRSHYHSHAVQCMHPSEMVVELRTGRRPLGHSSAHPSVRSLDSKDASMHGLWPSGPLAPSPPPQLTEGGSPSLPVSPRPRGNLSLTARERGLRGINPRRTSGHKTARKRYHHPALCIWAWPGRCHVRLARPRPTATPHTASH